MPQDIHDIEWFRNKFKKDNKPSQVMTAQQYRSHVSRNPLEGKKPSTAKDHMKNSLKESGLPFQSEHRFSPDRKFRFDWAVITTHCRIGIEYEGLMSAKSRHTTIGGFSKDTEKYNLAQSLGWVVLRYTALTYKNMMKDVISTIENLAK